MTIHLDFSYRYDYNYTRVHHGGKLEGGKLEQSWNSWLVFVIQGYKMMNPQAQVDACI